MLIFGDRQDLVGTQPMELEAPLAVLLVDPEARAGDPEEVVVLPVDPEARAGVPEAVVVRAQPAAAAAAGGALPLPDLVSFSFSGCAPAPGGGKALP